MYFKPFWCKQVWQIWVNIYSCAGVCVCVSRKWVNSPTKLTTVNVMILSVSNCTMQCLHFSLNSPCVSRTICVFSFILFSSLHFVRFCFCRFFLIHMCAGTFDWLFWQVSNHIMWTWTTNKCTDKYCHCPVFALLRRRWRWIIIKRKNETRRSSE